MTAKDPETWMWERAKAMLEQADRLHRSAFRRPGTSRPSWEPPVDVFETATELWVVVALPGVDPDCVLVEVEGPEILVSGERALPAPFRRATVHRLEIPHGRFERRVELPPGAYELTQSRFAHGCLFLSLGKID